MNWFRPLAGADLVVAESSQLAGRTGAAWPGARLLVLVHGRDDPVLAEVLARGVDGIADTGDRDDDLAEAVAAVLRGGGWVSPQLAPRVLATVRTGTAARLRPPAMVATALTSREHDVARLVAVGLTNSEIARELHVAVSTVKFHMSNVLSKLSCRDRAQLVAVLHAAPVRHTSRTP